MPLDFTQKHICLTGGTDGIGLSLATRLATLGAKILVVGRRSKSELILPENCFYLQSDLSKPESSRQVADHMAALKWKHLNHLVHNAGMGYVGPLAHQESENIAEIIEVNLKTPLALTNLLFPRLATASGSVCFIGSTMATRSTPQFATYTATKTGLADLARNLATEWEGRVRIQEVHPGPTKTAFHQKSGLNNPPMASLFMTPDEVAHGIAKALYSGKRKTSYRAQSLLFHAAKRWIVGEKR